MVFVPVVFVAVETTIGIEKTSVLGKIIGLNISVVYCDFS